MTQTLPLQGIKVVEIASIGPGPFCAMMLADHGADVIRVEKPGGRDVGTSHFDKDVLLRGRRKVALDLKNADHVAKALDLIAEADMLVEGFRPGVMERLGLGPEACHDRNPKLVYGRMTGWGQSGPLAPRAGHDINYIALTGALDAVGTRESGPVPPMNLVGDFGGGGMLLAFGLLAALNKARTMGEGSVVDAAMVDGAALLMAMPYSLKAQGLWDGGRGNNLLDGGAPFYGTFRTSDEKWIAIGAIEPPFFAELSQKLGLPDDFMASRFQRPHWEEVRGAIEAKIASKPRAHWVELFEGSDACVAPVLTMEEAADDAHNRARGVFAEIDGVTQPAPAPRYGKDAPSTRPVEQGFHEVDAVLGDWGAKA